MTARCTPDCAFYSPAGGCPIHGGGPADSLTRPIEDLLEPADVERIEHLWEMGYGTSQHTMALIRTLRAAWAELGTVNGLLEYFGSLPDLAAEIRRVQYREATPAEAAPLEAAINRRDDRIKAIMGGLPEGSNTGHGHVLARPDGVKARCGGPGLCSDCSRDAARTAPAGPKMAALPVPGPLTRGLPPP